MAYVDLNPVRAGKARSLEDSRYTAIQARIKGRDSSLAPMRDSGRDGFTLPITNAEYLQLVDWTGRHRHPGKRGMIRARPPRIVENLKHSSHREWFEEMGNLTRHYFRAIGDAVALNEYRSHLGQSRLRGLVR
ncbi:MAG: hypothetical protein U5K76_02290 [Woeseiaceae bacterium]|nr:hypothetical protein [Woeseiaceae bacterium]